MELSHTQAAIGAAFDDPNLIASAGLVPLIALAEFAGLLDSIQDMSILFTRALGHGKQGASFGYSGVRGLNASAATVTAPGGAPVIARTRLRKGSANSAKGAERIAADPPARPDTKWNIPEGTVIRNTATPPTAPEPETTISAATPHPSVHSG